MSNVRYLIVHTANPVEPGAGTGSAETTTLSVARALVAGGGSVVVAAPLVGGERSIDGIQFWDLGASTDAAAALHRAGAEGDYTLITTDFIPVLEESLCDIRCTGRCVLVLGSVGGDIDAPFHLVDGVVCGSEGAARCCLERGLDAAKLVIEPSAQGLAHALRRFVERRADEQVTRKRVGFLTTWNQRCGLAAYAQTMVGHMPAGSYVVYGEAIDDAPAASDEPFVRRVWSRASGDYSKLSAAVASDDIGLLHINCVTRFFHQPAFAEFIGEMRRAGIKVIAHLHTVYTADDGTAALIGAVDGVIVHSRESRLEAIANGAAPERVVVVPLGITVQPEVAPEERSELRKKLGLEPDIAVIVAFGFLHAHKGMEGVIEGVQRLKKFGIRAQGVIIGSHQPSSASGARYLAYLKGSARHADVEKEITFVDRFAADDEVNDYLRAADLVLMNYRCNHFEASGACAMALGARAIVAASIAPQFMGLEDAVWHITAGYPADLSIELVLTRPELRKEIQRRAARYLANNSWGRVTSKILSFYRKFDFYPTVEAGKEKAVAHNQAKTDGAGGMRVLMHNRPNTLTQRGGDTVVIERLKAGLEARGVAVTLDLTGAENPADYDIVHLFNFVLPDMTRAFAERAKRAGTPFVVTTLNEDIPSFHNQSIVTADALIDYVKKGQDKSWWMEFRPDISRVQPSGSCDNSWTARNAARLFTNGSRETAVLRKMYPGSAPMSEVRLGHEVAPAADPNLFINQYGVRDFILCVGRLESRKNQLMLLKALEDSELPVVLAAGGFTYQPEYDKAVRAFKRKGVTLVLDRLSPEMLASAYAAAKVHVLPSWYELPGLVSLEAAHFGCNVVVTDRGTAWDYFGDEAFYCRAEDEQSIANAVVAAYYSPLRPGLRAAAEKAQWSTMVEETLNHYRSIVGASPRAAIDSAEGSITTTTGETERSVMMNSKTETTTKPVAAHEAPKSSSPRPSAFYTGETMTTSAGDTTASVEGASSGGQSLASMNFNELLEQGEAAARAYEYHQAHEFLREAERINPNSVRSMRARGAVFLAEGNITEAQRYFDRALMIDGSDPKTLSGLGMCAMQNKAPETAYKHLVKALDIAPDQLVAMLQLIECSYALERYTDLEAALRRYMTRHPNDVDMRYCLAGCLFKMNRFDESAAFTREVLAAKPDHAGAQQLSEMIEKTRAAAPLTSKIETEVTGPSRTSRPGTGVSGIEQCADAALGEIDELKQRGDFEAMKKSCVELLGRTGLTTEQMERAMVMCAEGEILTGDLAQGQRLYDEVLMRNPTSARALSGKGALSAHAGDWVGAREYFERALRSSPAFDIALTGMGMCCAQGGETERAWDFYTRASKANPENTRAILGLIELGYPAKRFAEIETALKAYLEFHPADLDFVYSLAGCLYVQGKHAEALEAVARIELFEPSNERARELRDAIEGRSAGMGSSAADSTR